jgi:hypothetical protein
MISSAKKDFSSDYSHLCTMSLMDYMGAWEKSKFQLHDYFSGSCCRMQTCVIVEQKNPSGFSFDLDISVYDAEVVAVPC